ncbi:hypothetical protein V5O48_016056 [Marasmius crinis-equi]|uniref:Uncharacterized protein n=1 Tax=Marasmius crinis-equi TaxID=585013 RepID=A0ABR3ESR8_9AGAR
MADYNWGNEFGPFGEVQGEEGEVVLRAFLPQQLGNSDSPPSQIVPLLQADQILYALAAASNADGAGVFLATWNQLANSLPEW